MDNFAEKVIQLGQKCLEQVPVLVLGSGASYPHGIGGMRELQLHLVSKMSPASESEAASWQLFLNELKSGKDLETALHDVRLTPPLEAQVISLTRDLILADDQKVFRALVKEEVSFPLTKLIRYLHRTTHSLVSVITTNYDRVAEYAVDAAGIEHATGFSRGYYRRFYGGKQYEGFAQNDKIVEILKVHGSVDWFIDQHGDSVALPDAITAPTSLTPLMVTPGTGKYAVTHEEPFRSIITRSDGAFEKARGVFCVGYGFNDRHIQPKLRKRVLSDAAPVVLLARTLTPNAKGFIQECSHKSWLALEESEAGCRAYFSEQPKGVEVPIALWEFDKFLSEVIGTV